MMAEAPSERVEPAWTDARAPPKVPDVEAATDVPTAEVTTAATEEATYVLRASATLALLDEEEVSGIYPLRESSRMPE